MAVVGNLLMAVDEGRAHKFKGKNPRNIQLADKKITIQFVYEKDLVSKYGVSKMNMKDFGRVDDDSPDDSMETRDERGGSSSQMTQIPGTSREKSKTSHYPPSESEEIDDTDSTS
ncbi:Hypothetical predicted protein, partial [Paramuricea clavata]